MKFTEYNGVRFYEGLPDYCRIIKDEKVEIGGYIFQEAQLKNLSDVKNLLAIKAKASGANAIVNFVYGQKSVSWFRSLFQLDDVNWYGSGSSAVIEDFSNSRR